ncbi:MAG: DUF1819 family protein [Anaerolineae bacterium]|nr:DUF1819 family protein [Anaerolineae bacterium]
MQSTASEPCPYRDIGFYSARNSSKGALIPEIGSVIAGLCGGFLLNELHTRALNGELFSQHARSTRRRIWSAIQHMYLSQPAWGLADLQTAYENGPLSREFVSLLYLHYALRDRLTFDFVTQVLWERWQTQQINVGPQDIHALLDRASESQPQIRRWTESTRTRLVRHILAALRDLGLLEGIYKKTLGQPILPLPTAEHLLRILIAEGLRGGEVLRDPSWRLFFCTENDVAHLLSQLAQERRIRFERVGGTVVLQVPEEWSQSG